VNHNRGRYSRNPDGTINRAPRRCNDRQTWCKCCELNAHETTEHCFWQCPRAMKVWSWVQNIMQNATPSQPRDFSISLEQALLSDALICHKSSPKMLWELLRAVVGRLIWNTRCIKCMELREADHSEAIHKIWHRIKVYLYAEWFKRCGQLKTGKVTTLEAQQLFSKDFGKDRQIYYFDQDQLVVSRLAPSINV
jgi:hypothetical protein